MTRFVELSWVPQDLRRSHGGPAHACLTAPSSPPESDTRGGPFRLAAVAGLPGRVVDAVVPPYRLVVAPAARDVRDRAVLIRTGWDRHRVSERDRPCGPYLDEATVDVLLAGGAALVGVDFPSVNGPHDCAPAARRRLLRAGIVVVEDLCNLSALPIEGFRFFAVPLVAGRARVRAFAELLPP